MTPHQLVKGTGHLVPLELHPEHSTKPIGPSVENQAYVASCLCMFLSIFRILFFLFFNFPGLMQFTAIITVIIIFDLESF